ncbi:MAG TPA: hypothetical protein DCY41_06910, partial [Opitutae bacterium]|nr:hypothetical protein [Opitutae bacterium]
MNTVYARIGFCVLSLALSHVVAAPIKPAATSRAFAARDKVRMAEMNVDLAGAKELYLVVSDLGSNNSDWADWIEPTLVMADGSTRPLISLKWKKAESSWGSVMVGKNTDKGPLKVSGQT